MSHVAHTNEPCRTYTSRRRYKRVILNIQMGHIKHTNGSNRTNKRVQILEQTGDSAQTREHMKESHRIYRWGMLRLQTSHELEADSSDSAHSYTHMAESYCIYNWGMLHIQICRVPDTNEVMSQMQMSHITCANESRTWSRLERFGGTANYHCYRRSWEISHIPYAIELCRTFEGIMSHIRMSHVTHTNASYHTYECLQMSHATPNYENYHISGGVSHITPNYESLYDPREYVMSRKQMTLQMQ